MKRMNPELEKEIAKQARYWLTQAIQDARHIAGFAEIAARAEGQHKESLERTVATMRAHLEKNLQRVAARCSEIANGRPIDASSALPAAPEAR